MQSKFTNYQIAHAVICILMASIIANFASGGGRFSPALAIFVMAYFIFGSQKYGPEYFRRMADLKTALLASVTWPYIAWKALDEPFSTTPKTYNVFVNEVFVGNLSEEENRNIRQMILGDPFFYFGQIMNILKVAIKALDSFIVRVPILAFWMLIGLAYFDTELYTDAIAFFQQGPVAIHEFLLKYFTLVMWIWFAAVLFRSVILGEVAGFKNKFGQEYCRLLRKKLNVVARGSVTLELNKAPGTNPANNSAFGVAE